MPSYTRRQFIQIGAAAGGAVATTGLASRWWGLDAAQAEDPSTDGDRVVPTFCELCFWNCGVLAHVKDGRVTKLTGNPAHPLSKGRLCPRGAGGTGLLYDPDRLRKPLIRAAKRGEDVFQEASWDAALNKVAEELLRVRERHGPEALALFTHGFGGSWWKHFMKAWGSPNVGAPSYAQCRGPREAAYTLTFGQGLGSPEPIDLANARVITFIGSHLGENMHNTQVQELAEAVGRGAQLVVVDPRFSVAAGKARYWLPIKPGTDIALLLAWMNVLLTEQRFDAEYVGKHCTGLEALKAHVADKTPEWAYPITGIRPDLIRESARLIASARPASLIHPGRHTTWYGDDTQRARAMAILAALLGSFGRRGGYLATSKFPLAGYPLAKAAAAAPGKAKADKPKTGGFPVADEVLASGLCDATKPGRALYDLKAWIVYGTNLIQALPAPQETIAAIQNLDFMVAIDVLPAEICGFADVVLPEATYLERDDDLAAPSYREPFVALRQEVVPPMFDSKPGWWIAKELANKVGLAEQFPWKDAREFVETRLTASKVDVAEIRRTGVVLGKRLPTCEEEGAAPPITTADGKVKLYSEELKQLGFDPLPAFYPPEEPPPGMFRMLAGRAPTHTFGRTTNNRLLAEPFPENEVWVSADAASALPFPLRSGDRVVLVNQDGVRSGPVRAKVTQRIRGDCVYLVHGWGHTAKGLRYARGRGASDSALTTRYKVDPIMGGTGVNVNFVRLEPGGGGGVMKRYAMAVDTRRCVACNACVIACKTENRVPNGGFRCWTAQETRGTFPDLALEVRSERCNHCVETPCVAACPTGASHVAEGGIVAVDRRKCTGCKACIAACPYGARYVHPAGHVDKCTFCLHRVTKGREPACVEICPTTALLFGDLSDPESPVARALRGGRVKTLRPEAGTKPQVFFLT